AGITQLPGDNASVGLLNYLGINTAYDSSAGSHADTKFAVIPVPEIHFTHQFENVPLTLGLGVYAPFGLADQWPDNSSFRSIAIKASLQYITVNPVLAWKPASTLSVAVGPTLNYSELDYDRGLFALNDNLEFKGRGYSAGFNAG